MSDQAVYQDVTCEVRRREDQGVYELGAYLNGVYVSFAVRKLGGVDDDLARAALARAQTTDTAPSPQNEPPTPQ